MLRLLHVSDLHLTPGSDRGYGLAVLRDIVAVAESLRVHAVLFCGHLVDKATDAVALGPELNACTAALPCSAYAIAGVRELPPVPLPGLGGALGRITLLDREPFSLLEVRGDGVVAELLAVPHQSTYATYADWGVPSKASPWRVVMAHAGVLGLASESVHPDSSLTAMEPQVFAHLGADYVALGGVHERPADPGAHNGTVMGYSGAARHGRFAAEGACGAVLVTLGGGKVHTRMVRLPAAGIHRMLHVAVDADGEPLWSLCPLPTLAPEDSFCVHLWGMVCCDEAVVQAVRRAKERFSGARAVEVDTSRLGVSPLAGDPATAGRVHAAWAAHAIRDRVSASSDALLARQVALESVCERQGVMA